MAEARGLAGVPDFEAMDCALGLRDGQTQAIFTAMASRELVTCDGGIVAWEKRQPKREREDDSAAERKRRQREREAGVTPADTPSNATHADVTPCHAESHQKTPRGEESREEPSPPSEKKGARKRADPGASVDRPESVAESVWSDWLALRKAKKAPVTGTVLQNAEGEARKAGVTLEDFLRIWCARGSQGLQAEWLTARDRQSVAAPSETAYARQMREKYEQVCPDIAAKRPGAAASITVDMEPSDAIAIR